MWNADQRADVKRLANTSPTIKIVASASLPEVLRMKDIAHVMSTNLLLDEVHRKYSLLTVR